MQLNTRGAYVILTSKSNCILVILQKFRFFMNLIYTLQQIINKFLLHQITDLNPLTPRRQRIQHGNIGFVPSN